MKIPIDIRIPKETVNDDYVKIINWLVSSGDFVNKDDILVEIETSKTTIEIEAEEEGIIEIIFPKGSNVPIGEVIGRITRDTSIQIKSTIRQQNIVGNEQNDNLPSTNEVVNQMNAAKEILMSLGIDVFGIKASDGPRLIKLLALVHLADWLSYHLAVIRDADPIPIERIDLLKSKMAESEKTSKPVFRG